MENNLPWKNRKGKWFPLLILAVALFLPVQAAAQDLWEGNAAVGGYGLLPVRGYYGASNSFPRNTLIRVENLENGKQAEILIVDRLENNNLLLLLSQEAASALGMNSEGISRVRAILSSGETLSSLGIAEDRPFSQDPDQNPASSLGLPGDTDSLLALSHFPEDAPAENGSLSGDFPDEEGASAAETAGPAEDLAGPDTHDGPDGPGGDIPPAGDVALVPEDYPGDTEKDDALVDVYGLLWEEPPGEAEVPEGMITSPEIPPEIPPEEWLAEVPPGDTAQEPGDVPPVPEDSPRVDELSMIFQETWDGGYDIADLPEEPDASWRGAGTDEVEVEADLLADSGDAAGEEEPYGGDTPEVADLDEEGESGGAEGLPEDTETELVLVPADERPPQTDEAVPYPDTSGEIPYFEPEEPEVPGDVLIAEEPGEAGELGAVEEPGTAEESGGAEEPAPFIPPAVPAPGHLVQKLEEGFHYVQIGAFADEAGALAAVNHLAAVSPLPADSYIPAFIWFAGAGPAQYRVLVGPLTSDESGAMLYNLRGWGYRDAFVRQAALGPR